MRSSPHFPTTMELSCHAISKMSLIPLNQRQNKSFRYIVSVSTFTQWPEKSLAEFRSEVRSRVRKQHTGWDKTLQFAEMERERQCASIEKIICEVSIKCQCYRPRKSHNQVWSFEEDIAVHWTLVSNIVPVLQGAYYGKIFPTMWVCKSLCTMFTRCSHSTAKTLTAVLRTTHWIVQPGFPWVVQPWTPLYI